MARNLQATQEAHTIGQTLDKVQQILTQASGAMRTIKNLQTTMNQAQQGSTALADGSRAVAGGVKQLVDQTRKIGSGLGEASSFLLNMKRDAEKPSMAGFDLPPQIMTRDEFKKGAQIFLSPDGHAARYFIQSALNPFTTEAMDQIDKIINAARSAQPNTELSDASVGVAGVPSGLKDTRDYYNNDINFIVIATILIVFLILVVLLRAVVAPLYLIGSVLLSYLSAMGLGVLVFQIILGQYLHWSLPGLSFILLVAVGADYNMLLISRIRDESPHGVRVGVIRTVGSTGGVITSAGLIFAASMFGLMTASIYTMAEAGFILGMGILIDTFLVRTITVPALAAMIGQKNWWPSHLGKTAAQVNAAEVTRRRQRAQLSDLLVRLKIVPSQKSQTSLTAQPATTPASHPNGHASDRRPATSSAATKYGKSSNDELYDHSLPLFNLTGLAHRLSSDLRESQMHSTIAKNGKHKIDRYLGHALPPVSIRTNCNGNGNGEQPIIDDDLSHPLPLFGPTVR